MTKYELFLKAVENTLEFEGGYVNDPVDPGGETKYGISKRAYPSLNIKNLTRDSAIKIYEIDYWNNSIASKLDDEEVAMKVFDLGVHMGRTGVRKIVSAALDKHYKDVVPSDIDLAELLNDLGEFNALKSIREVATEHYKAIVKKNPKMKKYIKGWLRRVNS